MEKILTLSLLSLTLFVVNSWALGDWNADSREEPRSVIDGCETHFNMKLVSLDGEWESYMHYAAEDGTAVLPDNNCEKVTWFQLTGKQIFKDYGTDSATNDCRCKRSCVGWASKW